MTNLSSCSVWDDRVPFQFTAWHESAFTRARANERLRATFVTIGKAWLLPWVVFFVSMLTLELSRQWIKIRLRSEFFWRFGEAARWNLRIVSAHASWKLRRRFRQLASESTSLPGAAWLRFGRRQNIEILLNAERNRILLPDITRT